MLNVSNTIVNMSDTTNLDDLPSEPNSGFSQHNVVLQTNEKNTNYNPNVENGPQGGQQQQQQIQQQQMQPNTQIDEQKIMNELVTGIQQASASGATALPSRDMPTNTVHFADEEIKPNFVPVPEQKEHLDYIQNSDTEQEIMARRMHNQKSRDSLEILYDEFQIPIIIGILYFIFQLPVVKSKFLTMLPSLYNLDGNPNLTGYVVNSLFFCVSYYVISKSLQQLQNI